MRAERLSTGAREEFHSVCKLHRVRIHAVTVLPSRRPSCPLMSSRRLLVFLVAAGEIGSVYRETIVRPTTAIACNAGAEEIGHSPVLPSEAPSCVHFPLEK